MAKIVSIVTARSKGRWFSFSKLGAGLFLTGLAACGAADPADVANQPATPVDLVESAQTRSEPAQLPTQGKTESLAQAQSPTGAVQKDGATEACSYSFARTCINIHWSSSEVSAECRRPNGTLNKTSIPRTTFDNCPGDIANREGYLVCEEGGGCDLQ